MESICLYFIKRVTPQRNMVPLDSLLDGFNDAIVWPDGDPTIVDVPFAADRMGTPGHIT